jgi:5'(3')-deoxyribonucleotidase
MPTTEYFDMILEYLKDKEWYILSSPTRSSKSLSGKHEWIKRHFGITFRNFIITPQKHLLAGPNTLLIDDSIEKVEKFARCGGDSMHVPSPLNIYKKAGC